MTRVLTGGVVVTERHSGSRLGPCGLRAKMGVIETQLLGATAAGHQV